MFRNPPNVQDTLLTASQSSATQYMNGVLLCKSCLRDSVVDYSSFVNEELEFVCPSRPPLFAPHLCVVMRERGTSEKKCQAAITVHAGLMQTLSFLCYPNCFLRAARGMFLIIVQRRDTAGSRQHVINGEGDPETLRFDVSRRRSRCIYCYRDSFKLCCAKSMWH